jgi:hypothetical protein
MSTNSKQAIGEEQKSLDLTVKTTSNLLMPRPKRKAFGLNQEQI